MKNKHIRLLTAVAVLCLGRGVRGQVPETDYLRGEVHLDSSTPVRTAVTLSGLHSNNAFAAADVGNDGRFELRHVPYGDYRLTVSAGGEPIHEEWISVHEQPQMILVEVHRRDPPRPPSGTVSAAELLHPPTKKALQAFQAARKLADAGAHDRAAGQLELAVRLSPSFTEAWINLAAQHILMNRYEEALQELAHASEISAPTAMILSNMAYAQYSLRRYDEGTRSARAALRLDPSYAPAHYLLGSLLALDRRTLAEGLQHLEVAARTMPGAQANLERARRDSALVVTHP